MRVRDDNVRLKIRQPRSLSLQAALESAIDLQSFRLASRHRNRLWPNVSWNVRRVEETKEPPVNCEGDAQMRIRVEMRKNGTIVTREKRINQSSRETNHGRLHEAKVDRRQPVALDEILKLRCMEALSGLVDGFIMNSPCTFKKILA